MCKGWWGKTRLVSNPLSKCRLCSSAGTSSQQRGTPGILPAAAGGCERGIPSCALHMPSVCPSGKEFYSTGQVSVQAQGSLPSFKISRAVIFSSSAYRNQKFLSCPFLLAENRQLRDRPERTSGPHTPGIGRSCFSPGYF